MKIEGLLNMEEIEEVKEDIKILEKGKTYEVESGFLGVKISDKTDDTIFYDVYRIIAVVSVKGKIKDDKK